MTIGNVNLSPKSSPQLELMSMKVRLNRIDKTKLLPTSSEDGEFTFFKINSCKELVSYIYSNHGLQYRGS